MTPALSGLEGRSPLLRSAKKREGAPLFFPHVCRPNQLRFPLLFLAALTPPGRRAQRASRFSWVCPPLLVVEAETPDASRRTSYQRRRHSAPPVRATPAAGSILSVTTSPGPSRGETGAVTPHDHVARIDLGLTVGRGAESVGNSMGRYQPLGHRPSSTCRARIGGAGTASLSLRLTGRRLRREPAGAPVKWDPRKRTIASLDERGNVRLARHERQNLGRVDLLVDASVAVRLPSGLAVPVLVQEKPARISL